MITLDEAKVFLLIANTDNDALISALIPAVQAQIISATESLFIADKGKLTASTISFAAATREISDSKSGFNTAKLGESSFVAVEGSVSNDGLFRGDTVVAGKITLEGTQVLKDEDAGEKVTISQAIIPEDIKRLAADMVGQGLKVASAGIASERLGDYAVPYASNYADSFPVTFQNRIAPYRKLARD